MNFVLISLTAYAWLYAKFKSTVSTWCVRFNMSCLRAIWLLCIPAEEIHGHPSHWIWFRRLKPPMTIAKSYVPRLAMSISKFSKLSTWPKIVVCDFLSFFCLSCLLCFSADHSAKPSSQWLRRLHSSPPLRGLWFCRVDIPRSKPEQRPDGKCLPSDW